ncbi:nucleoside triphosphate pyrophosphohydrolase [Pseudomaricurvus alkylphenolicus]|jgi:ATP diphosphatase|uniref:nucleoside triphosphate pyrophosphohydrolase n=1 Tax=Pseudomaricurvus alkylphenolicus TaxID=1306991 RepID=UPI0014209DC3|nr:nucleoside triphosphate pyrophosphohydrolase [Pseudomaricurvus alkylphenolicus]NIB43300.1 nucleoside triphosphate pyrophosphohydrolase [Pseudomaricurvus alkylphenolicus]
MTAYNIDDLKTLMQRLREPGSGCPWDLEQTYRTIAPSTLEEAYEVVDAIERENYGHLQEELGDLLFQVIFYSQIAAEEERFDFDRVVSELVTKLVRRHPHVFPDNTLESRFTSERTEDDERQIKKRWEEIKEQERQAKGQRGVLDDIPLNLPALSRAAKLQKRASNVGFDWPDPGGVVSKIEEELQEVKEALAQGDSQAVSEELGDLIFAVVNLSRHCKGDAEAQLRAANQKFEDRFRYIEQRLQEQGVDVKSASLEVMDQLWDEAKIQLAQCPAQ